MPDTSEKPYRVALLEADYPLTESNCQRMEAEGAEILHVLATDPAELAEACRYADAVTTFLTDIPAQTIAAMERCRVIVRLGVGYDCVDHAFAKTRNIPVCNVPDYCMGEVSDHAMALALALTRGLPALDASVRQGGDWTPVLPYPIRSAETTVFGIIGCGRIGKTTLGRAKGFGYPILVHDPYLLPADIEAMGAKSVSLEEVLSLSDIVTLHTPLTPETHLLLNAERLAMMKPTAILINTARGKLIDTIALAEALTAKKLGAAGVDVFEDEPLPLDHPLRSAPNTLLTPHWAWHSSESKERLHRMGTDEVIRALRGEALRGRINP